MSTTGSGRHKIWRLGGDAFQTPPTKVKIPTLFSSSRSKAPKYKNKLGLIDKHSVGSDVERGGGLHLCVSFRHSVNFYDCAEKRVLYKELQSCKSPLPLLQSTPDLVLLLPEVIDTKSQWLMQTSFNLTSRGGVVEK